MKQKLVTIIIACSLFAAIGGGSILLHGGIRPTSDFARNVSGGDGWSGEQDNARDDGRNKNDKRGENDGVGNGKAKYGSEAKNGGEIDNNSESDNSSVRTMRGNRKDGMEEIGFTLYKEAFVLSDGGITDSERLVKTILANGWKIEDSDILPIVNAAGTMYGTVMESGQGKQEIVFKPDEEVRREDTIILVVDTGSVPGYKKDEISIECHKGTITVKAVHKFDNKEHHDKKYVCRERYYGKLERSFYLGDIDEDSIKAEYNDGILKLTISLNKETNKKLITIE